MKKEKITITRKEYDEIVHMILEEFEEHGLPEKAGLNAAINYAMLGALLFTEREGYDA